MIITGFHSIEEKLRAYGNDHNKKDKNRNRNSSKEIKLYYSKVGPRIKKILAESEEAGVVSEKVQDAQLDQMVLALDESLRDHRGIVMEISGQSENNAVLVDFDAWVKSAGSIASDASENAVSSSGRKTVVVLDRVTDPHNVGAILRSCDQFGVSLVVLPEHKSASDVLKNEVIGRASAGANAWIPVAVVNNLVRAVEKLKDAGFWVYGADAGGKNCRKIDFPEKTVLIMGSEGTGIADLLEKQCDEIVSIPTCGKIDSLNVSVAAGILLYELSSRQN